jgi:hypothetical protein
MLPELRRRDITPAGLAKEYSSADDVMSLDATTHLLHEQRLMPEDVAADLAEVLR